MVAAAVVFAAAGEASGGAPDGTDAAHFVAAGGTMIAVLAGDLFARQREIVATALILQAKVSTGAPPFGSMGRDAAPAGASVGDEVRELMKEGALDFCVAELPEAWVELDQ